MDGQVFITQGDITQLYADAIAVTRGITFNRHSANFSYLDRPAKERLAERQRKGREATPEGPFWVPFEGEDTHPRGIVFVPNQYPRLHGEKHPAYRMVTGAVETAIRHLRDRAASGPAPDPGAAPPHYLIALIAFRMAHGGDRHDRFVSAQAQIEAAYDAIARHGDIDIAFVLDDRAKYEIFLQARCRHLEISGIDRPPFDTDALSDLVTALKGGECVVFVGAGFSINSGLTGYRALMGRMATELGMTDKVGEGQDLYLDIAQLYHDTKGPDAVAGLLAELYGRKRGATPSLAHYLLLSLPVRFVITTNYDSLLEDALQALHRYPMRVLDEHQVAQTGFHDSTYVVKFHGDAEGGKIVLCRDQYDAFFRDRPEMASLLEGLLLNQTFFFLGYSLRDPNFRQIYGKIDIMLRNARRPAYAATFETTTPLLRDHLARRQLRLLELSDPTAVPKDTHAARRLLYLLDRLGEAVCEGTRLFLSREAPSPLPLQDVRTALLEAGRHLADAIESGALGREEIRTAARILSLLGEMGWEPGRSAAGGDGPKARRDGTPGRRMQDLWQSMADALSDTDTATRRERRQLILSALRYADGITDARALQETLRILDQNEAKRSADPP